MHTGEKKHDIILYVFSACLAEIIACQNLLNKVDFMLDIEVFRTLTDIILTFNSVQY